MEKTSLVVFDGLGVKHHSPEMQIFAETTSELPVTTNLSDKKAEHEMSADASDSNLIKKSECPFEGFVAWEGN